MTNLPDPKQQPCDRTYGAGAYTAKVINGEPCCTSCSQPLKLHRKAKG
jgi:hypothetical protein